MEIDINLMLPKIFSKLRKKYKTWLKKKDAGVPKYLQGLRKDKRNNKQCDIIVTHIKKIKKSKKRGVQAPLFMLVYTYQMREKDDILQ